MVVNKTKILLRIAAFHSVPASILQNWNVHLLQSHFLSNKINIWSFPIWKGIAIGFSSLSHWITALHTSLETVYSFNQSCVNIQARDSKSLSFSELTFSLSSSSQCVNEHISQILPIKYLFGSEEIIVMIAVGSLMGFSTTAICLI